MKPIRCLIISPTPTRPQTAANRKRVEFTIEALTELGPVCFAAPFRTHDERNGIQEVASHYGIDYVTMLAPNLRSIAHRGFFKLTNMWRGLTGVTAEEHYSYFLQLHEKIIAATKDSPPDFILVHYWYCADYIRQLSGKVALDAHDVAYRSLLQRGLLPQAALAKKREEVALRRFPLILSINPNESEELGKMSGGAQVELLPMAVKADAKLSSGSDIERNSIRFLGALDSPSNADGMHWMIRDVFPKLLLECPQAKLVIAGRRADEKLRNACLRTGVEYIGEVDDAGRFWRKAHVAISPLRFGTGMKLKVVEALGCGAALAATERGVDGVAVEDGKHYLRGDDVKGLAQAIARILRDDKLRDRLSRAGWQLVRETYDHDRLKQRMQDIVRKYVG